MTLDAPEAHEESLGAEPAEPQSSRIEERLASAALALLPGALIAYFSFQGGGFFAGSVGFATLIVLQVLVVRVLLAGRPFAGISRRHVVVTGSLGLYAGWTLASAIWSHAFGRALVEFDRALLYLLLLMLFGSLPRRVWRMPLLLRGLAAGSLVVCTVALISRVLPRVWPISPGVATSRLSYPLTYWNALGILAALCILFLVGLSASPREPRALRVVAAAGVPIAATTLFLTFSRGAIAALVVGTIVFVLLSRSSALPGALLAVIPPTAISVVFAYRADLLATVNPTTPAAVAQGQKVAVVVLGAVIASGVLRALLLPVDGWLHRSAQRRQISRSTRWTAGITALTTLIIVALIAGAPGWASSQFRQFIKSAPTSAVNLRSRLTDPSGDNRTDNWRAALDGFATAPVLGTGAGTYEFSWYRYRHLKGLNVVDAHSLYIQTLSELGIVGLALLSLTILGILYALARRIRGPNRVVYVALLAASAAWAAHAAVDWDWQMPAVTAWVFAVGGGALATSKTPRGGGTPLLRRIPIAVVLVIAAIPPALLMLSQAKLETAANAFQIGACSRVEQAARDSIDVLSVRPQPYQMLGYCDISDGRAQAAVVAMSRAVQAEPGYWQSHYGLSIAQAYAGEDPRQQLRTALRLDPGDPLMQEMSLALRRRTPAAWLSIARSAYANTFASGRLTLR
ncbi:MAG: O-antigen ligase family protein [Solirubrobacteraceae bacterium]